jgi:hypothetical protein
VVLQYEGVVDLAGVTAALKLPSGFKAQFPLTDDRNNYNVALSSYRGQIYPSQGVVLYFSVNILPTARVQLPVLGPLALHFLRSSQRSILDSLDASEQNMFAKRLSVMHTGNGTLPISTMLNDKFDFKRDYFNQFGRLIPYDFVNQVIPVTFKITGQETIDVVTLPTTGKDAVNGSSTQIVQIPYGVTTKVRLAVRNTGDVPIWDCGLVASPALQSTLGINGLNPSVITSPNIPQTLFSTINPLGIVGPNGEQSCSPGIGAGVLTPNNSTEADFSVFPTHYVEGTVQLFNLELTWRNVLSEMVEQHNQVYFVVTPPI